MKKSHHHGLRYTAKTIHTKKKAFFFFPTIFGSRIPVIYLETISDEKVLPPLS